MRLLFTRIGKTISPISGREVKRDSVQDVIKEAKTLEDGNRILVLTPIKLEKVLITDVEASNGIIHAIDSVVLP